MRWPAGRVAQWSLITAATAFLSRWLSNTMAARAPVRLPGPPAACEPAAARAQQQFADTLPWRWVETRIARRAVYPFRVRPTFQPLRVLNLDHGPGGVATALALETPRDSLIVATDTVPGMADLARHRAARRGAAPPADAILTPPSDLPAARRRGMPQTSPGPARRLHFARAWPYALPFAAGAFDLVVSAGGLHQWSHAEAVLAEVRRVLSPRGRFLILDLRRDLPLPLWVALRALQALVVPRDLRALDEPSASLRAAYAPHEAEWLAARAKLPGFQIKASRLWLAIEGGAPLS